MPAGHSEVPTPSAGLPDRLAAAEEEITGLRRALETRELIGVAIGRLAERYRCTSTEAWGFLTRLSSHTNVPVREVARVLDSLAAGELAAGDEAVAGLLGRHLPDHRGAARAMAFVEDAGRAPTR